MKWWLVLIPVGMERGEPVVSVALDAPPPDVGQFQVTPARPTAAIGGGWPGGKKVGNDPNSQGSKTRPGLRAVTYFVG
ncbi:MAG: hypothetical protein HY774_18055 [Acidobacteria bacterium]|nr:hypothetical protein [Acidobacteriota bacterium]